ncbi:MAG TPA: hypothetical protein ENK49_10195 [Gammaproteobacteria bacterium]|nr:hypothetical protein [Gammaproteobacteria bacterium]
MNPVPLRVLYRLLLAILVSVAGVQATAGVQPSSGPLYGGTAITITGSNFDVSADVYVDGNQATGIVVVDATTITAVTPEGFTAGPVDIDVQTTSDTFSFPGAFTYVTPTITSVNPPQGSIVGGTNVTISGTLFTAGMQLSFDGNPASNLSVVDSNTMTATTPAGFVEGPVSVDIDYLSTFTSLANGFTYLQPRIDAITPSSGSVDGGTPVTITGAYFDSDVSIDFDGTSAIAVTFVDSNTITAVTPPGASGPVSVDLTIGGGSGYASGTFTYLDPTIASVVPASGAESGGTPVTITGTLFDPSATVEFGGIGATNVTVVDSNTITAETPAGAGVVDVTVTTVNSQAVLSPGFTYIAAPPPQVSSVTPQSGDSNGGLPITITGTDFQNNASARLGGTPIGNLVVVDSTTITGDTPALSAGTYSLTVTNPDGQSSTLVNVFTVTQAPQGLPAGDLAPRGNPDGQLNVGDLLVLERLVLGLEAPNSYDQLVGDIAPLNNPDGQLDAGDVVLLQRAVMGDITLPAVFDSIPPQISILAPTEGSTITRTSVAVIGVLDEPANVSVNGSNLGTVTSFNTTVILQQGANTLTITATDAFGNLATAVVNVTVDSRAPVPTNISKVTVTEPVSGQVSFTGSTGAAEPGATIRFTNTTTSTTVTAVADASGAFTRQFSAAGGDIIQVAIVDTAGNTSESVAYTVGAQVQIVTPTQNATVEGTRTHVSGVFSSGPGSGVTVNGAQACVFGNAFFINEFPLQAGSNTLTATLTDSTGATDQHAVPVTSNGNLVLTLDADDDCGVAPLTVNFALGTAGINVRRIDINFDGDGAPDFSTTDVSAAISTTYATPGVYPATAWMLDDQGLEHEAHLNIVARDETAQDDIFQQIWGNFSTALAAGDTTTALQSINTQSRGFYSPVLQALAANLPEIAGDLSGIEKIQIDENFAEYALLTVVNGQVSTFIVRFARDTDGIWRIVSM